MIKFPGWTIRNAQIFARWPDTKYASNAMIMYSIHIPFRAIRKVEFVKFPIASTVLYKVMTYTIIQAVMAVKKIDSPLVLGIVRSSVFCVLCNNHNSFLSDKKDNKCARPSDSGQVTFIVFVLSERLQGTADGRLCGRLLYLVFIYDFCSLAER